MEGRTNKSTAPAAQNFDHLPPWMAKMRQAAISSITEQDVQDIVKSQVAKAKGGDSAAIKFVFEQLLGGNMKGATFIQNNFADGSRPDQPTQAIPGTPEKLDIIQKRIAGGNGAFNNRDREHVNLD